MRLLLRQRSLWGLAALPFAVALAFLAGAVAAVVTFAGELHGFVTVWMPALEAASGWDWIWVGPAKVALAILAGLLFLAVAGAAVVVAFLLASVVAAPFLDALSRRVEAIVSGRVEEAQVTGFRALVREGARAAREETKRTLFFLLVQAVIWLGGILLPGGALVAAPAAALVTMLFLPLDFASYALDRRRIAFAAKRRWVLDRGALMLGFGGAAFALCLVPGINLLAMPVFVTAGTLLALQYPPDSA